ncbi:Glutamate 5-kinase [Salmonella enterica subsp. enterica]|uniref:Glutamate 5-kinase n=1 Tax=Salmonella enterica I TaxID=59201 RepID=A0A3S4INX9_SALET|nr:Glutamate 5-kinase [Salmonella enterica subsp. enterica]
MEGISVGTRFHAQASPLENRKRWIFGAPPAGEITVDEGATAAMLERGSSLLPKRHQKRDGQFLAGGRSSEFVTCKGVILLMASAVITVMLCGG